jgi:dTDP-4-amino-4,6-dideoxygalactose transaminase
MLALDVGPGDEVIVPALTFVADANVVRVVGAIPVPADCVSTQDWNICPRDIERKITPRTKAVIVVHYAGYPCEMDNLVQLCHNRKIRLVEDVAHAPGAKFRGMACGTFGDIGCFSFFSNKNLSIGEGGMLATSDAELARRLGYLRSHGMTTLTLDRHEGRAYTYDVVQPGLNYRMDEVHAALGLVQLEKLPDGNRRRGELTCEYRRRLTGKGVEVPFSELSKVQPAYHIMPILLPPDVDRMALMATLKTDGVQTSVHYPPLWSFSAYKGMLRDTTPIANSICDRELTLPLYPTMTDQELDYVVESILKGIGS